MKATTPKTLCRREDATAILRHLRENGHTAYFAGGCVRDLLLGFEPKDWDVATDASPQRVRQLFPKTQAVGAAFGVILVRQGKSVIEVATFRTDLSYADGRRPEGVKFSTPQEDAQRRDFTINGLFLDPLTNQVIDFVGGQADLKDRVLRAIGHADHRFEEDHLRLMRAVRFAARFGLTIEPATADAIVKNAPYLIRISPERIADELRLTLTPPTRIRAYQLLWEFDLVRVILRDLPEKSAEPDGHLFEYLAPRESVSFGLALAGLVLDYRQRDHSHTNITDLLGKTEVQRAVRACRKDLKISNDEAAMLTSCLNLSPLFADAAPTIAQMKRFLASVHSVEARSMLAALSESNPVLRPRIQWLQGQFVELLKADVAPTPLVDGQDLLAAGLRAGPLFKRILEVVYDAQLEGEISTRQEAMKMALEMASRA
ncbi:MAG TPA: CCA tRNA nucleotidyltransferase [Tepidisphaeraceae bacterium]|nr:CCA tRNA nucleotidyltransferase [Tepidisphaeraceae bacterium]